MTQITTPQRAHGYIMIEVMIAMFIFVSMATYALYNQNMENKANEGRLLGQQYLAINQAVGNYMVTHYAALENLPVACSKTAFAIGTPPALDTTLDCGLTISSTVSVNNGMQPTVAELIAAGFLKKARVSGGTSVGVPSIPMDATVKETNPSTGVAATAAGRLFINIDRVCLATHTATPGSNSLPQTPSASGCPALTTTSLTSLVFNTQPYTMSTHTNFGYGNRMGALWTEIGADVAMSNMTTGGELKGANFEVTNPIRKTVGNVGVAGIVAVRNGYGAAYANNHSRVDGSNPPTADWSFANNSIKDVGKMSAKSVEADSVVAKVADVEALKLGNRTEGASCDASKENVSYGGDSILTCKSGKWQQFGARGMVNGLEYYEFVLNKYAGKGMTFDLTHCPTTGCTDSFSFTDGGVRWLDTNLKPEEWQPVLMQFQDNPTMFTFLNIVFGHLTQVNVGFDTNNGTYSVSVSSGSGLASQLTGAEEIRVVGRFYKITQ